MSSITAHAIAAFERDGCAVVDRLLVQREIDTLIELIDPLLAQGDRKRPGVRRVLQREPRIRSIIDASPISALITRLGGPLARIVRSIAFDKSPEVNWLVPWHQDPTIAVAERTPDPGFDCWLIKEGEHHCRPPLAVLNSIFIIRVHLDPCGTSNGPLRVIAGSHRMGLLNSQQVDSSAASGPVLECITVAGGCVLMRPLTVHSSPKATATIGRRRVLHLECTSLSLPHGIEWAETAEHMFD